MVKIESLSDEEKADRKKVRTLVDITKEVCQGEKIAGEQDMGFVLIPQNDTEDRGKYITITLITDNYIKISSQERFDIAMKLAQEYEKRTGEEFIIKKGYED